MVAVAFEEIEFSIAETNKKYEVRENCIIEKKTKNNYSWVGAKIPDDIKNIEDKAFYTNSIKGIKFPPNIESIGEFGFSDDNKRKKAILNEGLKETASWTFCGLRIKSVVTPSSVDMGGYVFWCCEKLKNIL